MKFHKNKQIRIRIATLLSVTTFLLLGCISLTVVFWAYFSAESNLDDEIYKNFQQIRNISSIILDNNNRELKNAINQIKQGNQFSNLVRSLSEKSKSASQKELERLSQENLDILIISDLNNNLLFQTSSPIFTTPLDYSKIRPYIDSETESKVIHIPAESLEAPPTSIMIQQSKITDPKSGQILGHIIGGSLFNNNLTLIHELQSHTNSKLVAIVASNHIIAANRPLNDPKVKNLISQLKTDTFSNSSLIRLNSLTIQSNNVKFDNENSQITVINGIESDSYRKLDLLLFKTITLLFVLTVVLFFLLNEGVRNLVINPLQNILDMIKFDRETDPNPDYIDIDEFAQIRDRIRGDIISLRSTQKSLSRINSKLSKILVLHDQLSSCRYLLEAMMWSAQTVFDEITSIRAGQCRIGLHTFWNTENPCLIWQDFDYLDIKNSLLPLRFSGNNYEMLKHKMTSNDFSKLLNRFESYRVFEEKDKIFIRLNNADMEFGFLRFDFDPKEKLSADQLSFLNLLSNTVSLSLENISHNKYLREIAQQRENELETIQKELIKTAHRAGMSEVISGVLHNIGNILTTINISSAQIQRQQHEREIELIKKLTYQIENQTSTRESLPQEKICEFLKGISDILQAKNQALKSLTTRLDSSVQLAVNSIRSQQKLSKSSSLREKIDLSEMVEAALEIDPTLIKNANIRLEKEFCEKIAPIEGSSNSLINIIFNLIKNSVEALIECKRPDKVLKITVEQTDHSVILAVSDNGIGILPENLENVFTYGFTNKVDGHGFGLHVSALSISEIGGTLTVTSEGENKGATFHLEVPILNSAKRY